MGGSKIRRALELGDVHARGDHRADRPAGRQRHPGRRHHRGVGVRRGGWRLHDGLPPAAPRHRLRHVVAYGQTVRGAGPPRAAAPRHCLRHVVGYGQTVRTGPPTAPPRHRLCHVAAHEQTVWTRPPPSPPRYSLRHVVDTALISCVFQRHVFCRRRRMHRSVHTALHHAG